MNCEILAPCGSFEALEAAVRSGADAVYLGAGDFNARRNARNFDGEELERAAVFCAQHAVKLYLTLNTLLHDSELPVALALAEKANRFGVDALIVQDPPIGTHGILPCGTFARIIGGGTARGLSSSNRAQYGDRGIRPRRVVHELFGAMLFICPVGLPQRKPRIMCSALPFGISGGGVDGIRSVAQGSFLF